MSLTGNPDTEPVGEYGIDEEDLRSRLDFLGFSEEDFARLKALPPSLSALQTDLVDGFIRHLQGFEQAGRHLPSDSSFEDRFRNSLASYFTRLTSGPYDMEYARSRFRVGALHEGIKIPPRCYLGAYAHYLSDFLSKIRESVHGRPSELVATLRSLLKAVFFDIGLTLDSYIYENGRSARILQEYDEKLLANLPDGILLLSSSLTVMAANRTFLHLSGLGEGDVLGKPADEALRSPALAAWIRETRDPGRTEGDRPFFVGEIGGPDPRPVRVLLVDIRPSDQESWILLVVEDLAEENRLRAQSVGIERRFVNLAETAISGIVLVDSSGKIVYFNASSEKMFGVRRNRILGRPVGTVLPGAALLFSDPASDLTDPVREVAGRKADGTEFPVEISLSRFKDESGAFMTIVLRDISERKQFEERILQLANFDPLTGLPNRTHLVGRLTQALAPVSQEIGKGALLFLDLDRFKGINDSMGHDSGDALLIEVGQRLLKVVRKEDLVAHSGGDEFIILLEGVGDRKKAERIAEKILDEIARPFNIDHAPVFVNASIGIVVWPMDGTTVDILLRRADTAMYRAKEIGNTCAVYASEDGVLVDRKYEIERELRRALEKDEFELFYQPQVDLATKRTVGAEALIRWNHPEKGLLLPNDFIPVAEATGLILAIGSWVIRSACEQLRIWMHAGIPPLRLTVNVSGRQFERGSLTNTFRTALEHSGIEGRFLEVEITESVLMKRPMTPDELRELAKMGIKTSIDDFGTGYSSLSYLTRLPIYKLKIDRSFVTPLPTDPNVRAIATAIITMGAALGLRTIAEGVETREQLDILKGLGCHEIQGFYFSPPLPQSEFVEWVKERDLRSS